MWQPATFSLHNSQDEVTRALTLLWWYQSDVEILYQKHQQVSGQTWVHPEVQIKPHMFYQLLLCLQRSHAVRNSCKRVKAEQGSSQTNLQVFCLPLSSLTAAESWAISFQGGLTMSKTSTCCQLCCCTQWLLSGDAPRLQVEVSKGLRKKNYWRVPRGRLVIVC